MTLTSITPVNGHTLEAQMRSLNGLPVINVAPVVAPRCGANLIMFDAKVTDSALSALTRRPPAFLAAVWSSQS